MAFSYPDIEKNFTTVSTLIPVLTAYEKEHLGERQPLPERYLSLSDEEMDRRILAAKRTLGRRLVIQGLKGNAHVRTRVPGKSITQILYRRLYRTTGGASLQPVQRPVQGGRQHCNIAIIVLKTHRFDVEIEAGLDDRGTDRIVAAARTQRRDRALVVASRITERIARRIGGVEFRFRQIGHGATLRSGVPRGLILRSASASAMRRAMKRAVIGEPS